MDILVYDHRRSNNLRIVQVEDDETVDSPISPSNKDTVYNIPADIRPKMASYRLEVIFWGVRDMKKINYMPVLKPRIVIECAGVDVKSEVMENAKKFSNFEEPHILVDLVSNYRILYIMEKLENIFSSNKVYISNCKFLEV